MSGAPTLQGPANIESASPDRRWAGLFILLMLLHPVLVWAFPYFPSQDGPIHLGIAQTLADYDNP
ncbi:MAG: hypothetical protein OEN55_05540, partial [Alphaproteobacteria bacterium]|nr:hypothetical protein [Alphaproteobacteria bacterium]